MSAQRPDFGRIAVEFAHDSRAAMARHLAAALAALDAEDERDQADIAAGIAAAAAAAVDAEPEAEPDREQAERDRADIAAGIAAAAAAAPEPDAEAERDRADMIAAAAAAAAELPPTRAQYRAAVARMMQTPYEVTISDIDSIPLPADVQTRAEADQLCEQGRIIFTRLFYREEDVAFDYLTSDRPCANKDVYALLMVLQCGRWADTKALIDTLPADALEEQRSIFEGMRRAVRGDATWMADYATVHAYINGPVRADLDLHLHLPSPSDAVCDAWRTIAFDSRQCARDVLVQRRGRHLIRVHTQALFDPTTTPAPGRPDNRDVEVYWSYLCAFGTDQQLESMFEFDPLAIRILLMQALRNAFPGWAPQRADGRVIESYEEQRLAGRCMEWERDMGNFERNVADYLQLTLDDRNDRLRALRFLVPAYGDRITPVMMYRALLRPGEKEGKAEANARPPRLFMHLVQTMWEPRVKPDRGAIVRDATLLYRSFGDLALDSFLFGIVPDLVHWPCEADTAFLGTLLDISPFARTRASLLRVFLEERIPEGSQHMTQQDVHQFLDPLWNRIPDTSDRNAVVRRFIATWTKFIPQAVHDRLLCTTNSSLMRGMIDDCVKSNHESIQARNARARALAQRHAGRIQDELAHEDASDDTTCVACKSNLRRVCFTPCGHIAVCLACADRCNKTCPMCRAAFTNAQPCIVPASSDTAAAPSPSSPSPASASAPASTSTLPSAMLE